MPNPPRAQIRIIVPSGLQMGWAKSPAFFSTATERGQDIIEMLLRQGVKLPEHPLQRFMQATDLPKTAPPGAKERTSVGVYVDDYLVGGVKNDD